MMQTGKILKRMNFLWTGKFRRKGVNQMRKIMCMAMVCLFAFGTFCVSAGATGAMAVPPPAEFQQEPSVSVLASGSFNMSVAPYGKSEADKTFPLEAGETVSISAVYSPDDASMDFGLVDPDGVFHYFNVTDGSIDKTIQVNENGNYTFAVRNNSGETVKVSGFVKY